MRADDEKRGDCARPRKPGYSDRIMMTLDLRLARAAGRDAGDRAMRAAGRDAWDASDWDIAAETTSRLLQAAHQAGGLDAAANDAAIGMMVSGAKRRARV